MISSTTALDKRMNWVRIVALIGGLILIGSISSCSPSEAAIATAIAETQIFEDGIVTAIAQTQQAQPTSTVIPTPTLGVGSTMVSDEDGMVLVYIPAGSFWMGSGLDDQNADEDERPGHEVTLDAFWIDQTEVTNAMYAVFLNYRGNQIKGGETWLDADDQHVLIEQVGNEWRAVSGFEDHPVVEVTWYGAVAYCEWAGRYLPTEAQWEKAARGEDGRTYPWGNIFDSSLANVDDETTDDDFKIECSPSGCDGFSMTSPVGFFANGASPYGVLDMAGNVWEWVADLYDQGYYDLSPMENPLGPDSGDERVLRSGSWGNSPKYVRGANRSSDSPDISANWGGFRCAWSEVAPLLIQPTPLPPPTSVPATETPESIMGTVTGKVCYPSEYIPAMMAYFDRLFAGELYDLPIAVNQTSYSVELPAGMYNAYAWLPDYSLGGHYSQAVACGLKDSCIDHSTLAFEVIAGETVRGIDLCDWYSQDEVPLPPGYQPVQETGAISGELMYPSEYIPGMKIVAFEKDGSSWFWTITPAFASEYTIENLPPGVYQVVAYNLEFDIAGGYTKAVTCGLTDGCNDHTLVDVIVESGRTTYGIDPWDWYAGPGAYPDMP